MKAKIIFHYVKCFPFFIVQTKRRNFFSEWKGKSCGGNFAKSSSRQVEDFHVWASLSSQQVWSIVLGVRLRLVRIFKRFVPLSLSLFHSQSIIGDPHQRPSTCKFWKVTFSSQRTLEINQQFWWQTRRQIELSMKLKSCHFGSSLGMFIQSWSNQEQNLSELGSMKNLPDARCSTIIYKFARKVTSGLPTQMETDSLHYCSPLRIIWWRA